MTVMRKEMRDLLTWCLAQPGRFRSPDAEKAFGLCQSTISQKFQRLEKRKFLQREIVRPQLHYFTVINREEAERVASTVSASDHQTAVRKSRAVRQLGTFARVNSIFSAGQQL